MIIKQVTFDKRAIQLCGDVPSDESNIITLIVGRNGSGKSNLFKNICEINIQSLLGSDSYTYNYSAESGLEKIKEGSITYCHGDITNKISITPQEPQKYDLSAFTPEEHLTILKRLSHHGETPSIISRLTDNPADTNYFPHLKIIAVSSSPFDKFPLIDHTYTERGNILKTHYIYRGARTNNRRSKSYLKSKFDQLGASFLNLFLKGDNHKIEITPLFEYLGLASKFKITLKPTEYFPLEEIFDKNSTRGPAEFVRSARFFKGLDSDSISDENKTKIAEAAKKICEKKIPTEHFSSKTNNFFTVELDLNPSKTLDDIQVDPLLEEYSILATFDLLDLESIEFQKTNNNSSFFLSKASSGELCILFNILSIAAEISDNSVILLDEPELSLHPEWQQEFLPLLHSIFSKYKQCHFIIATHSPQIVSSICSSNSFIVNLECEPAQIMEGKKFSSQSLNFQLTNIFKAPGNRNEYLINQIVDALTAIRDGKEIDSEFINKIHDLLKFRNTTPESDPVQKLLTTLSKALRVISK